MMVSRDKDKTHSGKVCDICGVSGFEDLIATCIKCRISSKHIYCLPTTVKEVPSEWTCEDCEQGDDVSLPTSRETIHQNIIQSAGHGHVSDNLRRQGWFKGPKTVETAKVKFLSTEEAIMLTSGANRMLSSFRCNIDSRCAPMRHRKSSNRTKVGFTSAFPEVPLKKLKENHGVQSSERSKPPPHFRTQTSLRIKQRSPQISKKLDGKKAIGAPEMTKASTLFPSVHVSGIKYHSDAEAFNSDKGWDPPIIAPEPEPENVHLKCASMPVWRGRFKFVDNATTNESYVGFQAHPPSIAHMKVIEFSKQMPKVLQFERLPRCSVWVQLFQDDSPDGDDIALYFFPGNFGRSRKDYVHLLKLLETQDLAMRSYMDGIELLLFTSKQMHTESQRIGLQYYLWGVFRCVKTNITKESMSIPFSVPPLEHPGDGYFNKDNNEVVDMETDMVGGKDVGRVDVAVGKVKKEQCNNHDSFPGFTVKVESRYLDPPPGFEEVLQLKLKGNSSKAVLKEKLRFDGVKTTIKKEVTSTELFSAGVTGSHSSQFQTASWRPVQVPAHQLLEYSTGNNPHFPEMGKKRPSPRTEEKNRKKQREKMP